MKTEEKIKVLKSALKLLTEQEYMCFAVKRALGFAYICEESKDSKSIMAALWKDRDKKKIYPNIKLGDCWYPDSDLKVRRANINRTIKRLKESLEVSN